MNFDEIKQTMDKEDSQLTVPMSISSIKSTQTSIQKMKRWLYSEVFCMLFIITVLAVSPIFIELHQSAQILYNYTAFISIMSILGVVIFQVRLIRSLKINDLNSKKAIEHHLLKIKTNIEISKYVGTGMFASIIIPMIISKIGNIFNPEAWTLTYLYLDIGYGQIALYIIYIIIVSVLIFMASAWMYKLTYVKEFKALEKILDQF